MRTSTKYFLLMVLYVFVLWYLYGFLAALLGFLIWFVSCANVLYYMIEKGKYNG